jgi:hypothetical protein
LLEFFVDGRFPANHDRQKQLLFIFARRTLVFIVVDRVLPAGPLQLYRDLHGGLVDLVVLSESLETLSEYLNAQHAIRYSFVGGAALQVRLQLKATPILLPFLDRMQNDAGISNRLPVVIANHQELEVRAFVRRHCEDGQACRP